MVLTDSVRGGAERLQLGAAAQEVRRNVLHAVLAHVEQPDLRQTQRRDELGQTVPERRERRNNASMSCSQTHTFVIAIKAPGSRGGSPFHGQLLQSSRGTAQIPRERCDLVVGQVELPQRRAADGGVKGQQGTHAVARDVERAQ